MNSMRKIRPTVSIGRVSRSGNCGQLSVRYYPNR
jgi:hypothetical protein